MNATTDLKTRAALAIAAALGLLATAGGVAAAASPVAPGVVPSRLGSPDANEAASVAVARAVRPDGAALRGTFDDLAARAAASRHASSGRGSETLSTDSGFSWRDAGIGGAATFLALVLVGGAVATISHRSKNPVRV